MGVMAEIEVTVVYGKWEKQNRHKMKLPHDKAILSRCLNDNRYVTVSLPWVKQSTSLQHDAVHNY